MSIVTHIRTSADCLIMPNEQWHSVRESFNIMECRHGCGACCIAPSINSPMPDMPYGKPAGVRCVQLNEAEECQLFGLPERPAFCGGLQPSLTMCGVSRAEAMCYLTQLELLTKPNASTTKKEQH